MSAPRLMIDELRSTQDDEIFKIETYRTTPYVNVDPRGARVTHIETGLSVDCADHAAVHSNIRAALTEVEDLVRCLHHD